MNNRTQQKFDRSIHEASMAVQQTKIKQEKQYLARMLPIWHERANVISNMLETGQANGRDLSGDVLKQLHFDLRLLNRKIQRALDIINYKL